MNKKRIIDDYLAGKHPLEHEEWELPMADELTHAEEEYDRLLAERREPKRRIMPLVLKWAAAAAVVAAVVILGTWRTNTPQPMPPNDMPKVQAEATEDTTRRNREDNTLKPQTQHVVFSHATGGKKKRHMPVIKEAPNAMDSLPLVNDSVMLATTADSLNFYLTKIEKEMENIEDSLYMEGIAHLMEVDARLQRVVNRLVGKQVETAMQSKASVDTILIITF